MDKTENERSLDVCRNLSVKETDRSGKTVFREETIIREHHMDVSINEKRVLKMICTPAHLPELVAGRMLTEGMIKTADDVACIFISEDGRNAKAVLKKEIPAGAVRLEKAGHFKWKQEWIFTLTDEFEKDMPLYQKTQSAHGCYLMINGSIAFQCEDIGRHNALDKVIGYALFQGLDLTKAIVYTTGRVAADMAEKVLRAGIPVLASRKKPTVEAIMMAEMYGLTIIGEAKRNKMTVYGKSRSF